MTDWEICRKIAAFHGWTRLHDTGRLDGQVFGYPQKSPVLLQFQEIPDYTGDLNVLHAFAMWLKTNHPQRYDKYVDILFEESTDSTTNDPDFSLLADAGIEVRVKAILEAIE